MHRIGQSIKSPLHNGARFHMQVVLVYLQPFRCNLLLKCVPQPKIVKNSLKPLFGGFKVIRGHRCW